MCTRDDLCFSLLLQQRESAFQHSEEALRCFEEEAKESASKVGSNSWLPVAGRPIGETGEEGDEAYGVMVMVGILHG